MSRETRRAPSARSIAARVLERVLKDGAFAAASLDAELTRALQLDSRERALATELVYGVLRTRRALEARLERHSPKGIRDFSTRLHLLVAAYQMLFLERVPAFAAVDAAVELVRAERGPRVGGFANAVLRKIAAENTRPTLADALRESAPRWLFERLAAAVGESEALMLLGAAESAPVVGVRPVAGHALPAWLEEAPAGRWSPRARRLERRGDPKKLPGYDDGAFVIQEEGAQVVTLLLGARRGERVLDACAGRGQKSSLLAELVGAEGELCVSDSHPEKLKALAHEFTRLGLALPASAAVDWSVGTGEVPGDFTRVLVDAPCSGTGTLRHRPEILERLEASDPERLGLLATSILRSAATRAKSGGRVVFAVCSVLAEEAEAVVAGVTDLLLPAPFDAPELAHWLPPDITQLRLLPGVHATDGYFVASFVKR